MATNVDATGTGWTIADPVVRLRVYGSERSFGLDGAAPWVLGAAAECSIQLDDRSGRVSRRHAIIERRDGSLVIMDVGSTNGIRQDGEARKWFVLTPGVEIELGGVKLIAESERSIVLRELLGRLVGWSATTEVDRALRAVREMANLRATLIIRGDGALDGAARRLHRLVLGDERPISTRPATETGMAALARCIGGTLYLDGEALPDDIEHVVVSLRLPDTRVRLIVGANTPESAARMAALTPMVASMWIPPLGERSDELDRVLEAYGNDAVAKLAAEGLCLRPHDLRWVREHGVNTHEEAEEVMLRLVAVRNWGVLAGAERLGITHGALSRWLKRRRIPT